MGDGIKVYPMWDLSGELTMILIIIWSVRKQAAQTFDVKIFSFKKLNELGVRTQYQIKISNKCAALENLK
jgi:hypothetical protein